MLLLKPLSYPEFIYLMNLAYVVVTDSGGVQAEATPTKSLLDSLDDLLGSSARYSQMVRADRPLWGREGRRSYHELTDRLCESPI
jgi:UDP-N-acetylglucosamine 2-epimerase